MVFPASNKILNPESMLFAKQKNSIKKNLKIKAAQFSISFYIFIVCCTWTRREWRHTWRLERLGQVQSNKNARVK